MTAAAPRIAVVGAGIAGAFFALELSRLRPGARISLFDRERGGSGAGIVVQEEFVRKVGAVHPELFALPPGRIRRWDRICMRIGGQEIVTKGHGTVGFSRAEFVNRLREAAASRPGVELRAESVSELPRGYDLVVAAEGAGSRLRDNRTASFGTRVTHGATKFLWLSTPAVLPAMFVLKQLGPGQLIVHAYPHADNESTLVVEADTDVLLAADLLYAPLPWVEKALAELLAADLGGAPVHAQTSEWRSFPTVVNRRWSTGEVVLIGDAAHTVHFSSGSGATLAIEDAMSLARALAECPTPAAAAEQYEAQRAPVLARAAEDAQASQTWFEWLSRQHSELAFQTAFALRTRRDMNTYGWFREHDPHFANSTVRELRSSVGEPPRDEDPIDVPLSMGALRLPNRRVLVDEGRGAPSSRLRLGVVGDEAAYTGTVAIEDPEQGLVMLPPDATGDACVLVCAAALHTAMELARRLRATGSFDAVGIAVPAGADRAQLAAAARDADFFAAAYEAGAGRVPRTALAAEARGRGGRPVMLITPAPLSADEINTLIAAGRVDLVASAPALFNALHPAGATVPTEGRAT